MTALIERVLTEYGKMINFPKKGIPGQTAEAKGTRINATIGQAFEDDGSPMVLEVMSSLVQFEPKTFLYSPNYGQKALRDAWKNRIIDNGAPSGTTLPIVTGGLTHGLYVTGRMFVEDDMVIAPDLMWGNYKLAFPHASFDQYALFDGDGLNLRGLESKLRGRNQKKIVLLNFPNNPTGYSPTIDESDDIITMMEKSADWDNDLVVICDDAYLGLVYEEGVQKDSLFGRLASLHENVLAIKIDGITKELFSWGLRVGFITYGMKGMDDETRMTLEDKTAGAVRGTVSNVCTHSQMLAIRTLGSPEFDAQVDANHSTLKERYETVRSAVEDDRYKEFFEPLPFNSGYFMCVRMKKHDPNEIRRRLIAEFSTGLISTGDMIRVAYSSVGAEVIPDIFENIYEACKLTEPKR